MYQDWMKKIPVVGDIDISNIEGEQKMDLDDEELKATRNKNAKCGFCKAKIYVQVERYSLPVLAPLTHVEELQHELINKTGIEYMQIPNNYCPICGRKLGE